MKKPILQRIPEHFRQKRELRAWAEPIAARTGLSADWIMADCKQFWDDHAVRREEYEELSLCTQPAALRDNFLGLNEQRVYLDYLNPKKYYIFSRNKFFANQYFRKMGLPAAQLYVCYWPEGEPSFDGTVATDLDGVLETLQRRKVSRCVVKAAEHSHGEGVLVIDKIDYGEQDACLTKYDGTTVMLSSLLGTEPLVFESVVRQTAQFAAFNPSSVNTVRFMTLLYPDGTARIMATFVKIGRPGRCVDNAGAGGNVDACIDTETGMLQYAIQYDGLQNMRDIDRHPDSGAPLNGVVVEDWEAIKEKVKRFQQAFPYCKAAGWDVAITDDGPVIIEVNDFWDRTGQLFIRRGWRREVRDCYLAWKATGREWVMGRDENKLSQKRIDHILTQ